MKLTFIANACQILESQGKKLLTDPWLVDGAFYGSWFHYPPLKTKPKDVADYDYLYISHLHPDHYDRETLKFFDKSKPVIIYDDQSNNFLEKILLKDNFTNIIKIKNGKSKELGPFRLTMFGPFTKHPFHECVVGNILDSCLVISDEEHVVINTNDNTPSIEAARMLKEDFPDIYVAQLNYNAAGPYPSCFENLDSLQLKAESKRILNRQLEHMVKVAHILDAEYTMPFAGAYVIGGKNIDKNKYLGTTTLDEAAKFLRKAGLRALALNEGDSIGAKYDRIYKRHMKDYIKSLETEPYTYEARTPRYTAKELDDMVVTARKRMYQKQLDNMFIIDHEFYVELEHVSYLMNLKDELVYRNSVGSQAFTRCTLPQTLFEEILERKAHWNNAEIGCHIQFFRQPNVYNPDFHTFMSFFHV